MKVDCSVALAFQRMVTLDGLFQRLKGYNHIVSQNKQHRMKVLFSSFLKNGHTAWFDPQTKKLETTLYQNNQHRMKVLFSSFPKNGHIAWFDPETKRLQPHFITKQTAPHESNVQ